MQGNTVNYPNHWNYKHETHSAVTEPSTNTRKNTDILLSDYRGPLLIYIRPRTKSSLLGVAPFRPGLHSRQKAICSINCVGNITYSIYTTMNTELAGFYFCINVVLCFCVNSKPCFSNIGKVACMLTLCALLPYLSHCQ